MIQYNFKPGYLHTCGRGLRDAFVAFGLTPGVARGFTGLSARDDQQ